LRHSLERLEDRVTPAAEIDVMVEGNAASYFERSDRYDMAVETMWSDDGIVIRLPEAETTLPLEDLVFGPDEIEASVIAALPQTALFASVFREASARALLLPRRRPGQRTPLWQQRQRAADLLEVASGYPSFPMLLETTRECLRDVFDLPSLREVLTDIRSRRVRVVPVVEKGAATRTFYLPQGTWYDFWTGDEVSGGAEITRHVDLKTIPLYVRAGAIIPTGPVKQHTGENADGTLTLTVYPGADGTAVVYEDDGASFAHQQNDQRQRQRFDEKCKG
jgi:hypothetical protein